MADTDCRTRSRRKRWHSGPRLAAAESTTLCVVATDAILTKAQAKRLAVMAQSGLVRAIYPVHTPLDGDVVFAAATGRVPLPDPLLGLAELGSSGRHCGSARDRTGGFRGGDATAIPGRASKLSPAAFIIAKGSPHFVEDACRCLDLALDCFPYDRWGSRR